MTQQSDLPLPGDLSELLGFPDPAHLRLPLGPLPVTGDPAELKAWLDLYQRQIDIAKAGVDLRRALTDASDKAHKHRTDLAKAELELAAAQRLDDDARAEAGRSLVYTFHDGVNDTSVRSAMATIGTWARREPGATIEILLHSQGGAVFGGFTLFDYLTHLRSRGHLVRIVVLGMAASTGGVLLQAASEGERVVGASAWMLMHEVSSVIDGSVSAMADQLALSARLQERSLVLLAERSTLSTAEIAARWTGKNWWLSAPEAVALGFADRIL